MSRFEYVEDAVDAYRQTLNSSDRSIVLSADIIDKLQWEFDMLVKDMTDASDEEFNEAVLSEIKKAHDEQLYGAN